MKFSGEKLKFAGEKKSIHWRIALLLGDMMVQDRGLLKDLRSENSFSRPNFLYAIKLTVVLCFSNVNQHNHFSFQDVLGSKRSQHTRENDNHYIT